MKKTSPVGEISEIDLLKQQIEELKALVMSQSASQQKEVKPKKERAVRPAKQEKSTDIPLNKYINVMSLVGNKLNLSTKAKGQGKTYSFENFGVIKKMFYSELLDIINNHPNFFEAGYFYILDSEVIESNNWVEMYEKILSKDNMESILNNAPNALQLFEGTNSKQRGVIVEFFVDKILSGQAVDFNLIANINRIGNVDIQQVAKERKEVSDLMVK